MKWLVLLILLPGVSAEADAARKQVTMCPEGLPWLELVTDLYQPGLTIATLTAAAFIKRGGTDPGWGPEVTTIGFIINPAVGMAILYALDAGGCQVTHEVSSSDSAFGILGIR